MKKVVNIILACSIVFFLSIAKGTASNLDAVICNAMKGMQAQEEKKIQIATARM